MSVKNNLGRKMKSLPSPLVVTAIVFGIVPLWSLLFMQRPWELLDQSTGWKSAVLIFNFWIGPFALSLLALTRHKFLIPMFLIECGTMLLNTMVELSADTSQLVGLQLVLVVALFFFAFFLFKTDALYPLMHGASRAWRGAPRMDVGLIFTASAAGKSAKVVLQDCSLTGMQLAGSTRHLRPLIHGKHKEDQLDFSLSLDGKSWDFTADIAWIREEDGEQRLGLHVPDKNGMTQFFESLPREEARNRALVIFNRYWQSKAVRQVALSLWAILIFAALLIPSVKRTFMPQSAAVKSAPTHIKAGLGPVNYRE